jgi:hypothetical protein
VNGIGFSRQACGRGPKTEAILSMFKLTELERLTELKSEMFYFREMFHFREPKISETMPPSVIPRVTGGDEALQKIKLRISTLSS